MIYLVFFSVGLPNSMLGAAWPSIQGELSASAEWMGVIAAICAGGTILSSLLCVRIVNRLGTSPDNLLQPPVDRCGADWLSGSVLSLYDLCGKLADRFKRRMSCGGIERLSFVAL